MSYTPRLTPPDYNTDLRYIMDDYGGYNLCIAGAYGPPSVLPDCTGYVHARVMEIRNVNTDDSGLSFGNGATYYTNSSPDWIQSQDPSLGAVACYYTKNTYQPGHVAIVEQIIDNDTIVVSESDYGNLPDVQPTYWRLVTCYRQYGWRPSNAWNVSAQGFLKNPYVTEGGNLKTWLMLAARALRRKKNEGDTDERKITNIL